MTYDVVAFGVLATLSLVLAAIAGKRLHWVSPRLLLGAVALRIVGSILRLEILDRYYAGVGDAKGYYGAGLRFAEKLWALDPSVLSADVWFAGRWWGTQFLRNISGLAVSVVGPSIRAEFLLFSLLAFAGLFAVALAVSRVSPQPLARRFAAFLWLWPSLWFWPSSVGKEALVILGIGIVVLGYLGLRGHPSWLLMVTGTLLVFCIRPHVALVVAGSIAVAGWLGTWRRVTVRRLLEIGAAAVVAAIAFQAMLAQFGFGAADLEGIREFAEFNAQQTLQGGSNIGASPLTGAGLPLAFVNVWLRPFLWEAHNVMAALSAVEIAIFWVIVWRHRKVAAFSIRQWRSSRVLRFATPFLVAYTLMIGMTFGNMGILARQRTPLFVFAFMPLAGVAATAPVRRRLRLRWAHRPPVRHHVEGAAPR